jgi:hypothetical protein
VKRDPALVRLSWDHHHGLALALRIARELPAADEGEVTALRNDLLRFWSAGLLPHFHGESDCLLARLLRRVDADDELVRRTLGDHLALARLVADLKDGADSVEILDRFGALLRAHIRWEESVLFERVQILFTPDELAALGVDLEEALPPLEPAPRRS